MRNPQFHVSGKRPMAPAGVSVKQTTSWKHEILYFGGNAMPLYQHFAGCERKHASVNWVIIGLGNHVSSRHCQGTIPRTNLQKFEFQHKLPVRKNAFEGNRIAILSSPQCIDTTFLSTVTNYWQKYVLLFQHTFYLFLSYHYQLEVHMSLGLCIYIMNFTYVNIYA